MSAHSTACAHELNNVVGDAKVRYTTCGVAAGLAMLAMLPSMCAVWSGTDGLAMLAMLAMLPPMCAVWSGTDGFWRGWWHGAFCVCGLDTCVFLHVWSCVWF